MKRPENHHHTSQTESLCELSGSVHSGLNLDPALYEKAIRFSSSGVLITDKNGVILYVNDALIDLTGYPREELLGAKPSVFKSGIHSDAFYAEMWASLTSGQAYKGVLVNARKDGQQYSEEVVINPILNRDGAITHYIGIKNDLSEKEQLLTHLTVALDAAKEASRVKSNLLGRLSHELRTPMNGIMGMSHLLKFSELDEEQTEMLQIIEQCSERMMETIAGLLDLSALENTELRLLEEAFDFKELFKQLVPAWTACAEARGLELKVLMPEEDLGRFYGDSTRIGTVFTILTKNACKFAERGIVEVRLECQFSGTLGRLSFEVIDEGPAIPENLADLIFEPFTQADESITRQFDGLGLGLPIAKRLVDAMHGRIEHERIDNRFTCFRVHLNLPQEGDAQAHPTATAEDEVAQSLQVLLAEDDYVNRQVLQQMVERIGHRVTLAEDGVEVLKLLETGQYDLILMDCRMPEKNGIETAKEIRQRYCHTENAHRDIPIIAITADIQRGSKCECLSAGMNAFLPKPVRYEELKSILAAYTPNPERKEDTQ